MWDSLVRGLSMGSLVSGAADSTASAATQQQQQQQAEDGASEASEAEEPAEAAAAAGGGGEGDRRKGLETARRQGSLRRLREALRQSRIQSPLYSASAAPASILEEEEAEETEETGDAEERQETDDAFRARRRTASTHADSGGAGSLASSSPSSASPQQQQRAPADAAAQRAANSAAAGAAATAAASAAAHAAGRRAAARRQQQQETAAEDEPTEAAEADEAETSEYEETAADAGWPDRAAAAAAAAEEAAAQEQPEAAASESDSATREAADSRLSSNVSQSAEEEGEIVSRGKTVSSAPSQFFSSRLRSLRGGHSTHMQQQQQQQQQQQGEEAEEMEQEGQQRPGGGDDPGASTAAATATATAAATAVETVSPAGGRGEPAVAAVSVAAKAQLDEEGFEVLTEFMPLASEGSEDGPLSASRAAPKVTCRGSPAAEAAAAATASADVAAAAGANVSLVNNPDKSAPVDHVLLVIHGIGCGSQNELQQQEQLRHSIRCVNSLWFWKKPVSVHVLAINWKRCIVEAQEHLFQSIGISSLYEMRRLLSLTAGDLLFFMTPRFGDFIMRQVAQQLNAAYLKLKHHVSGRFANSRFSLLGYSLGSVMAYELLSGKTYRPTLHTSREEVPKLRFNAECLFLLGGCLPAFLLLNSPEILKTGLKLPPDLHVYNLFHPCDPIAFRLEKLVYPHIKDIPPPVLLAYWRSNGLQTWYKWNLNVQQAKDMVTNNINNFTASVMSWWQRDMPSMGRWSLLAANAEAAASSPASQGNQQEASEEQQQQEQQQQQERHRRDSLGAGSSSNPQSARGESTGQLRDLQSFKSRLQQSPSRRRLPHLQAGSGSSSLSRVSSSKSVSSSSSLSSTVSPAEDDPFAHVANWFRMGSSLCSEETSPAAAAAATERLRAASAAAAAAVADADKVSPSRLQLGPNRQLRKLTPQDRINRRPRVHSHQETAAAAEGSPSAEGGEAVRRQSSRLQSARQPHGGFPSSQDYFTDSVEAAAAATVSGETHRAVLQLEAVNSLGVDQQMPARLDFQLQEDTAEHYLSSLAILNSHFNYFKLKDVAFFILKCLSGKNPLISYTDHLQLLEAAAKKAADHAAKEGRPEEQQRQLNEAAALAARLKAFEAALHRPRSKKSGKA